MLLLLAGPATAQLGLPQLPVPLPTLPVDVDLRGATGLVAQTTQPLQDARLTAARALIRSNRTTIEADPNGAPMRRSELLAYSPDSAALQRAVAAGFEVLRQQALDGLDLPIVVLRAPAGLSTRRALQRLRALDTTGSYDYNHIFMNSAAAADAAAAPAVAVTVTEPAAAEQFDIGLIDGGVDSEHPALQSAPVVLSGCGNRVVPTAHGTAVASLMVGDAAGFHGARPRASLLAVDVYCGLPTGGAVDAVAAAMALLVRHRVPVVNISLVGPANVLLQRVVSAAQAHGVLVVAAVGNDGPAAAPLYPAAYPGVVAVTAVDRNLRVLPEACRGPQVQFAAPGAALLAADARRGYAEVRGTSYAAPIVAGLVSKLLGGPDHDADDALRQLQLQARDLGKPGRDPIYGYGLVGEPLLHNQ